MAPSASPPHDLPAHRSYRTGIGPLALAGGLVAGGVLAGTLALWVHYGTAVFFEMIATGFAACF